MASSYELRIVECDTQRTVVVWPPGGERDFIDAVVQRVGEKGVGVTKTAAHVQAAVRASLVDVFRAAKASVVPRG